jgi:long-chain-fatty-acid--[acyl-carrier-protein] ligase
LDLKAVGDVVLMAMGKSPFVEELKPCQWDFMPDDGLVRESFAEQVTTQDTIIHCFKRAFKHLGNQSKCYDQIFGVQSAKDFLVKAYLIANILKRYPEKHIAIMLPSLSATSLLIMACYLAKKVPVMLNWTLSEEAFAHCVNAQELTVILTSKTFFKKVQTPWLQKYPMTFFEDLLKNLSLIQKLKALLQSKIFALPNSLDPEAVVLFTSGSEALPKAVMLTHQNILQDLKGAAGILDLRNDEILLAFLPPFHSFGFSINTMLPLVSPIRVVYSPDPNDAPTLNNLVQHTRLTLVTSTPTFFKGMCSIASQDQLSSLRLVVVGAERCPEELFNLLAVKVPGLTLLEGYGITECSPIISANPYSP